MSFQVVIGLAVAWLVCLILTVTGVLPDDPDKKGYKARTDAKLETLHESSWFYFPYPGKLMVKLKLMVNMVVSVI